MNMPVRMMLVTAAVVILPLYSAFSAQVGQEVQQGISLEGRIAQLQQRVRADPRDPDLHFELSKLYEENIERYYDDALSEFKVAVDKGLKGKTVIWNKLGTEMTNLGVLQVKRGEYDKAIKNFERATVFNPNHYLLYSNFAVAYRGKGNYDKAIEYIKKAIDLNPSKSSFYESAGQVYLENKDFKLSLLNLNRCLYLDPKNKKVYMSIGRAYKGLGEYNNAIDALDQLPRDLRRNETIKALRKECVGLLKQSN